MILKPDLKGKREFNGMVWENTSPFAWPSPFEDDYNLGLVLSLLLWLMVWMKPGLVALQMLLCQATDQAEDGVLFYDPSLWVLGFKPTSDQMRVQILLKKTRGNWGQESMLCFLKQKSSLRAEAPWSHRERKEHPWRRVVLYGPLGAVDEGLIGI